MLYVAYGSNMNMRQMAERCPAAQPIEAVTLRGWRLVMRGAADIIRDHQSATPAGLWCITTACLRELDIYEGYPALYTRQTITAWRSNGKRVRAMVYLMRGPLARPLRPGSTRYVRGIMDGYRDFGIGSHAPVLQAQHLAAAMRTGRLWRPTEDSLIARE